MPPASKKAQTVESCPQKLRVGDEGYRQAGSWWVAPPLLRMGSLRHACWQRPLLHHNRMPPAVRRSCWPAAGLLLDLHGLRGRLAPQT